MKTTAHVPAGNNITFLKKDREAEERAVKDKGVVLAVFAAGINRGGEVLQELMIDNAAAKALIQQGAVDADYYGPEA